jgi:aminoglycoside phosphotransferase
MQQILDWCADVLGPCELVSGDGRFHGRSKVWKLRTGAGHAYAKIHLQSAYWENEVHAYERWASAFGTRAPRLLAVRDEEPLALIVSEIPGRTMEGAELTVGQERGIWREAGRALPPLHKLEVGDCFGFCTRDGGCSGEPITGAIEFVEFEFERWLRRGRAIDCLTERELEVVREACEQMSVFRGERATPCHRDYCSANWMVGENGTWSGVIDFEFAYWDVRVADFCRYPEFEWIARPDLVDAFFEGYGRSLTEREERQRLVTLTRYALGSVVSGSESGWLGYAGDGRRALEHLGRVLA